MIKFRVQVGTTTYESFNYDAVVAFNGGSEEGIEHVSYELPSPKVVNKRELYSRHCDHITLEIVRKTVIGDPVDNELVDELIGITNKIKTHDGREELD